MTDRWHWPNDEALADLVAVRERGPLVHCLTNIVVANFTANVLLAVGAAPIMLENPQESGGFAARADAVLVNLGTLSPDRIEAMRLAAHAAREAGVPWVLDPVAAGAIEERTGLSHDLLDDRPAVLRGNGSEVMCVGGVGAPGKGVDSLAGAAEAVPAARAIARRWGCAVAVSGAVDHITDGERVVAVPGGDPLLTRVTGTGCVLGALMAAFVAVREDSVRAAAGASVVFAEAARRAGERTGTERPGPATFAGSLVDQLYHLAEGR